MGNRFKEYVSRSWVSRSGRGQILQLSPREPCDATGKVNADIIGVVQYWKGTLTPTATKNRMRTPEQQQPAKGSHVTGRRKELE